MLQVTDQNFAQEVLDAKGVTIVDFWAPWCMPCRVLGPIIDRLAGFYTGRAKVVKVNVDQNPVTAGKYQIMAIPTVILFKDGKELHRVPGVLPEAALKKLVDTALAG